MLAFPAEKIIACRNSEINCRKNSEGVATLKQVAGKNNYPPQHGKRPPKNFFGLCNPEIRPRKKT